MELTKEELIKQADKDLIEGKLDCMKYVELINKYTEEDAKKTMEKNPAGEREYI